MSRHFTGPGQDEDQNWPGPTYTDCKRCGRCTESYYADLCSRCEGRSPKPKSKRRPKS